MSINQDARWFCVRCFADDLGGSWGVGVLPDGAHCFNCGAGQSAVNIPRWAVESIREQACFVGTRYYPDDDYKKDRAELLLLRSKMPIPANRTAERALTAEGHWNVKQPTSESSYTSVMVVADSAEEALEKTKGRLPWVDAVKP